MEAKELETIVCAILAAGCLSARDQPKATPIDAVSLFDRVRGELRKKGTLTEQAAHPPFDKP